MPNVLKIKTHTTTLEVDVELHMEGRSKPFKQTTKTLYEAYLFADEVCGVNRYVVQYEGDGENE